MSDWKGKSKLSRKKGRYGCSKVKGFTVLQELPADQYLSVRQLCLWSGIGYYSLARALPKWITWEYVSRFPTTDIGEGDYMYKILEKGRSWQKLALEQLPNAPVFLQELRNWHQQVMTPEIYEKMRRLKFKDFTSELDGLITKFRGTKHPAE